jgi:hypothetical protein
MTEIDRLKVAIDEVTAAVDNLTDNVMTKLDELGGN